MREHIARAFQRLSRDRLWWTWIAAFVVLHLATQLSVAFGEASDAFVGPLPIATGIVLVHWWGLRVLPPLYLNAVLSAPMFSLPWADAPTYALAATLVVFLSWLFFTRLGDGDISMPDVGETVKFLLFGLLVPLATGELALHTERLTSDELAASGFWLEFGHGWLARVLASFMLTLPVLLLFSRRMCARGWVEGKKMSTEPPFVHLRGRGGEAVVPFAVAVALALTAPVETYWYLYGALLLGSALRFGAEIAVLANSWVLLLTVALPAMLPEGSSGGLAGATGTVDGYTALTAIGLAGVVTGRSVSDNLGEIERRTGAEGAVRESEARLRAIIEHMPVMIDAFDSGANIVAWNRECERVTGYSTAEIIGNPEALQLLYPSDADRNSVVTARVHRDEDYRDWECTVTCKDGAKKTIAWSNVSGSFPVPGWRAWGIGVDVTDWRAAEDQLREYALKFKASNDLLEARQLELEATNHALKGASGLAAAANRAKSEFLANMSHEIRTPMTAVLGFTDVLIDAENNADTPVTRMEALLTIKRNGEYLLELINDILDLSKIEAGRLEIQKVDFSPTEVIEGVRSLMNVRAKAKNLRLAIRYATPIPESIEADPTRFRQILINLVGNAIKFTEVGGVRVIVRLDDEQTPPVLWCDVIDTGIGMTEHQRARVFEPFSQADGSTTRRFGGTGLGLSICKRLSTLMGGTIEVESTVGGGSTFRVAMPTGDLEGVNRIVPDDEIGLGPRTIDPGVEEALRVDGFRILLAEDGPDNQRLIQHILSKAGADVTIAENGQVAVELATAALEESSPFDVILMDIQMPIVDGYLATRMLRRLGYSHPIIALTAHAMAGDRERCVEAGCDDFASKPIERSELLGILRRYARSKKRRKKKP
jgi:PAS domain S-box-containing protein